MCCFPRRFGFPSQEALAAGKTGTDCRGEEHDVVVVWSVTSGKRQIIMDGREVHYAATRVGVMDHSWSTKGNHVIKVVCHAAAPVTATPGFRQYDLFIDGQSFFTMPKVYELGLRGMPPPAAGNRGMTAPTPQLGYGGGYGNDSYGAPPVPPTGNVIRAPRSRDEEEADLQRAINESIEESKRLGTSNAGSSGTVPGAASSGFPSGDLLALDTGGDSSDFFTSGAPPAMTTPSSYAADNQSVYSYGTSVAGSSGLLPYGSPPPQQSHAIVPQQFGQPSYPGAPPPPSSYNNPPASMMSQALVPQPTAATSYPGAPPPPTTYNAPSPYTPVAPTASYTAPTPVQPSYSFGSPQPAAMAPTGTLLSYGPPSDDPFAPKPPSHNDLANEILSAYGPSTGSATWGGPSQTYQQLDPSYSAQGLYGAPPGGPYGAPPDSSAYLNGDVAHTNGTGGPPSLSMNALVDTDEKPQNPFDAAMKKLVNIDHIDEPAPEQLSLTMKKKEDESQKKNKHKSVPKPPAAARQVGTAATLSHIAEVKPKDSGPKDGIMNAPPPSLFNPNAVMAGALVVHGAPLPGQGPMMGQGFGVGYGPPQMMSGGYPTGYVAGYPPQPQMYAPQQAQYAPQPPPPQQYPPPLQQTGAFGYR
jgi:hypothetical protein